MWSQYLQLPVLIDSAVYTQIYFIYSAILYSVFYDVLTGNSGGPGINGQVRVMVYVVIMAFFCILNTD